MKAAHNPGAPHHPGLHLGPIDIEWGSLFVVLMVIVLAYLVAGAPLEVSAPTLVDPNLAP
jgi:hypothetical protein